MQESHTLTAVSWAGYYASQCVLNVDLYYYTAYSTIEELLEGQRLHCCEVITIVSANLLKVITVYLKGQFTCQVMLLHELRPLTRVYYHFLSTDTLIRSTLRQWITTNDISACALLYNCSNSRLGWKFYHLLILNFFFFSLTKQSYTDSEKKKPWGWWENFIRMWFLRECVATCNAHCTFRYFLVSHSVFCFIL